MNKTFLPVLVIIVLAAAIVGLSSLYVIEETEQAQITRFGEPIGEPVQKPGLYIKVPFIDKVNLFEDRILAWDGDPNRVPTKDKKFIWVDTTARWRITNPLKFMQTVRNYDGAFEKLDNILNGQTRTVITDHTLIEIVRTTNRVLELEGPSDVLKVAGTDLQTVERVPDGSGRDAIRQSIIDRAKIEVDEYGIELVDVLIKRINYEQDVRKNVFDRMISERKRAADKYRSEGDAEKARIEGVKAKEIQKISSEAYKEAQAIRGKADAEAVRVYAEAFNRDPEFYSFLTTLQSYEETLGKETTLVISTDNDYLNYMKTIGQ